MGWKTLSQEKQTGRKNRGSQAFQLYPKGQAHTFWTLFCSILGNSMTFLSYTQTNSTCLELNYSVEGTDGSFVLIIVYLMMYPFGSMLSNYLIHAYSVKSSLFSSGVLTLVALFFRILSLYRMDEDYSKYNGILSGQFLLGLAQPMLLNPVVKIANSWFSMAQRDWAVFFIYSAQPAGFILGFVLANTLANFSWGSGKEFSALYYTQLAVTTAGLLLSFTFKDAPESPPSRAKDYSILKSEQEKAANQNPPSPAQKCCRTPGQLLKDPEFVVLTFSFICIYMLTYGVLLSLTELPVSKPELSPINGSGFSGFLQIYALVAYGIGGSIGFGCYGVGLTSKFYHSTRKAGFLIMLGVVIGCGYMLKSSRVTNIVCAYFGFGLTTLPLIPVSLVGAAEITFDLSEDIFTGLFFSWGNIGLVVIYACLGDTAYGHQQMVAGLVLGILAVVFSILSYGEHKRLNEEGVDFLI